MSWFFILGAGASCDSGLPTFRGPEGIYVTDAEMTSLETFRKLKTAILENQPGPTYQLIKEIAPPGSYILNQNIDGYADTTGLEVVNMHVRGHVSSAADLEYENIVQIGEMLPREKAAEMYKLTKKGPVGYGKAKYILVIGTSMQFPYLRTFISRAKRWGAKVIHINPDENYINLTEACRYSTRYERYVVRNNEKWLQLTAYEGLKLIQEKGIEAVFDIWL